MRKSRQCRVCPIMLRKSYPRLYTSTSSCTELGYNCQDGNPNIEILEKSVRATRVESVEKTDYMNLVKVTFICESIYADEWRNLLKQANPE